MNMFLKNASLLVLLTFLSACANSGALVSLENDLRTGKSEFGYDVAFVSRNQPDPGGLFIDEKNSQSLIKHLLISKGYAVGQKFLSLSTHKAKLKGKALLIECSYSLPRRYKFENLRMYQLMHCGAFDLFDGEKVYSAEAQHEFLSFSSVYMVNDAGIKAALANLPQGKNNQGALLSESDEFSVVEFR